jgi:hypothetical protein
MSLFNFTIIEMQLFSVSHFPGSKAAWNKKEEGGELSCGYRAAGLQITCNAAEQKDTL